jgi:dipeptidyl aminopeptidase/acylaminoacyl peptidase
VFNMVSRRAFVAGAFLAGAGAGSPARALPFLGSRAPAPPTLADFFRSPVVGDAALSPGGARVALLGQAPPVPGDAPEAFIDVFDASDPARHPIRTPMPDLEVESVAWASEERLLVWVVAGRRPNPDRPGEEIVSRRVLAVDPDGAHPVVLFENRGRSGGLNLMEIVDALADEPGHVLMTAWDDRAQAPALYKVDVHTGQAVVQERGAASTVSWRCQGGAALLRYDLDREGRVVNLMTRAPGDNQWRLLRRIHRDETKDFQIVGATDQAGVVLVSARDEGEDAASVRTLDTRSMQLGPALSSREGRDVAQVLTNSSGRFVAAAYIEDRLTYDFAEPEMARHFAFLNQQYRDECNIELFDVDEGGTRWLARVSGPRNAGAYILYDAAEKRAVLLGMIRPWLRRESLAPGEALSVPTRDGHSIRAYLTRPIGVPRGPRPLVVMPHGGPETRDHMAYDPWAQALAAQGWLVVQPNFRGSGGFGRAFAAAGWGQWGGRMQEDVEDVVDLLIRQKRADPTRIAIFGASYGGYAALMGAVRRPAQYKAVIAAAAPTDLLEMLRFEKRRQKGDPTVYEFWRSRMGDPAHDKDALLSASPRRRAAEIKAPVLLVHGVKDDVVPVSQSRQMAEALRAAGGRVEIHEMAGVGHANWGLMAEHQAIARVVDFLKPALA